MIAKTLLLTLCCFAVGCGGAVYEITDDGADSGSEGTDASARDGGSARDASARDGGDKGTDAGPFACGTSACGENEYCVHPCCGGIRPLCTPLLDDGGCAPGDTFDEFCPTNGGTNGPGCDPAPCVPPAPYCTGTTGGGASCGPPPGDSRDVYCICG
jgi:hypothetical protein